MNSKPPQPTDNPKPDSKANLAQAVQKLEKEIKTPNSDPKLNGIYKIIKSLGKHTVYTSMDGTETIVLDAKNGMELFDKIIELAGKGEDIPHSHAVDWLINEQLINPNEIDAQKQHPLEKVLLMCANTSYTFSERVAELKEIAQLLKDKGAKFKFAVEKATVVLEKFIEECFIQNTPRNLDLEILNFLRSEGLSFSPNNKSTLLEKLLEKEINNRNRYLKLPELLEVVEFLKVQGATIDTKKANKLLQESIDQKQEEELCITLLEAGADPTIIITKNKDNPSLLYYAATNNYTILLQKLINNPKVDINLTNQYNRTLAMEKAYYGYRPDIIEALCSKSDLDINTIRCNNNSETPGYTLLDLVVDSCMGLPSGGHEIQQQSTLEKNNKWLKVLGQLSKHPNFYVTNENIEKANIKFQFLNTNYNNPYKLKAISIGQQTLDLLKNSPKRRNS